MQTPKGRPTHEIRIASIKAAIWRNDTSSGARYSVTFSRLYKDREEEKWKSTDSFGRADLLLVAKVADAAHTWILDQRPDLETPPSSRK